MKAKTVTALDRCTLGGKITYTQYVFGTQYGTGSNLDITCESYANAQASGYTGTLEEWVNKAAVIPFKSKLELALSIMPFKKAGSN